MWSHTVHDSTFERTTSGDPPSPADAIFSVRRCDTPAAIVVRLAFPTDVLHLFCLAASGLGELFDQATVILLDHVIGERDGVMEIDSRTVEPIGLAEYTSVQWGSAAPILSGQGSRL